jgi:hypothetical protein
LQPVRLVLLVLDGPREGENDFIEFPSIEDAVAYGREIHGDPRLQLEEIEDCGGRMIVCHADLNDRCSESDPWEQRRFG